MTRSTGKHQRRTVHCTRCQALCQVGIASKKDPLCADCRVDLATTAMRQMQARNGEYYERWVAGMLRHATKLAESVGEGHADQGSE